MMKQTMQIAAGNKQAVLSMAVVYTWYLIKDPETGTTTSKSSVEKCPLISAGARDREENTTCAVRNLIYKKSRRNPLQKFNPEEIHSTRNLIQKKSNPEI